MVELSIRQLTTKGANMHTQCPQCNITWEGNEIPGRLMGTGHYATFEDAEKAAASYGWTRENQHKFSINVVGIETPSYDGVSFWHCTGCDTYFDRWTGEVVEKAMVR